MIDEILSGVSIKLNSVFGDDYEVYVNDVNQGLSEPCFFIAVLSPSHAPLLGKRMKITMPLDVHYFPISDGDNYEMSRVGDQLFKALAFIKTPAFGSFHGRQMRWQIYDGVLHFFVTYIVILNEIENKESMEKLNIYPRTGKGK